MANKQINQLPTGTSVVSTDIFPIQNNSGVTKSVTAQMISDYVETNLTGGTGSQTLSDTLAIGQETGGNNIVITEGDNISSENGANSITTNNLFSNIFYDINLSGYSANNILGDAQANNKPIIASIISKDDDLFSYKFVQTTNGSSRSFFKETPSLIDNITETIVVNGSSYKLIGSNENLTSGIVADITLDLNALKGSEWGYEKQQDYGYDGGFQELKNKIEISKHWYEPGESLFKKDDVHVKYNETYGEILNDEYKGILFGTIEEPKTSYIHTMKWDGDGAGISRYKSNELNKTEESESSIIEDFDVTLKTNTVTRTADYTETSIVDEMDSSYLNTYTDSFDDYKQISLADDSQQYTSINQPYYSRQAVFIESTGRVDGLEIDPTNDNNGTRLFSEDDTSYSKFAIKPDSAQLVATDTSNDISVITAAASFTENVVTAASGQYSRLDVNPIRTMIKSSSDVTGTTVSTVEVFKDLVEVNSDRFLIETPYTTIRDDDATLLISSSVQITIESPDVYMDTILLHLGAIPTYADNAAAISGGLGVNCVYKTATGELRIRV